MSTGKFDPRNPTRLLNENDDDGNEKQTEEDALLEQDIEGSRPKKSGPKSAKLGYESDSSDDGQTWREKEKLRKENDDDDDDMFASDEEKKGNESNPSNIKPYKQTRFLDMDNFNRQAEIEDDTKNEDHSDDDEEEVTESNVDINYYVNPEDSNNSSQHRREPKLESFNLQDDLEEGQFDEEGNFIRSAEDSAAHQDQWLNDISKKDINKAREAHRKRVDSKEDQVDEIMPKSVVISNLIGLLDIGESPLEALQRIHKLSKSKKKERDDSDLKHEIEKITEFTDKLMQMGVDDIYERTREELSRDYRRETGENYEDPRKRKRSSSPDVTISNSVQWKFKWSLDTSEETHGPYSTEEMMSWYEHGYFDEQVVVKRSAEAQEEDTDFVPFKEAFGA